MIMNIHIYYNENNYVFHTKKKDKNLITYFLESNKLALLCTVVMGLKI